MESNEPEAAVLGACLVEAGAIGEVADFLVVSDFYSEQHQLIYGAMLDLWKVGEPVSEVTISVKLREKKKLKLAGGASYLAQMSMMLPDVTSTGVEYYSKEVKKHSLKRRLRRIGKLLETDDGDPDDLLNETMEKLVNAGADSLKSVPKSLGEYTNQVTIESIAISKGEAKRDAIYTGMDKFDAVTCGLEPSDLIIIGAQPSVGKSAFSLWISKLVAEQNHPVLFVSLEMSGKQIGTRMLAAETGIRFSLIQDGKLSDLARHDIENANNKLQMLPFTIDDRAGQSIGDIRTKARREQVRTGLDLLVVDYLQIATPTPDDVGEIARISTGLKAIAKDLKIPVIALSQMSRNIQHRDNKEPVLADLKQSSQIEQDADLVGFLHYRDQRKLNEVTFSAKKHRNGPLGEVLYYFDKDLQRFNELDGRTE